MARAAEPWCPLTTVRKKLIKISAMVVSHSRYLTYQMTEVTVPRQLFRVILSLITGLRTPSAPA